MALDMDTITINEDGTTRIQAVWFKNKGQSKAIYSGELIVQLPNSEPITTVQEFVNVFCKAEEVILKKGGNSYLNRFSGVRAELGWTQFKWDGTEMWSEYNFLKQMEAYKKLDPILKSFPLLPSNYMTWFSTDKKDRGFLTD